MRGRARLIGFVALLAACAGGLAPGAPRPLLAQTVPSAAVLTLNDTQFRPGETLAVGLTAAVPAGNPATDLYVGVILPGGQLALFFSAPGVLAGPMSVLSPALFPRFQPAPPGFELNTLSFFQFTFPATGVAPGTYQLFAALVRQGTLADNRIDPGDLLSVDFRPVAFGNSIQLNPASGPSGTFVTVSGSSFTAASRITFGAAEVPGVFVSAAQLGFEVPFAQQGVSAVALGPGTQAVSVDGGPSQTFTVTSPPANPNPPGVVAQGAVTSTSQALSQNRAAIDATLLALEAESASAAATTYLNTMSGLLSDVEALFAQDLATLSGSLDAATLATLEQALLAPPPAAPPGVPLLPLAAVRVASPSLAGDDFLARRQGLIAAGAQAERAGRVLSLLCPLSTGSACSIAGVAFHLVSVIADLMVGSSGEVVGLRIDATSGVVGRDADRLTLRLTSGSRPGLSAFIAVQRQLNALDPQKLALEIEAAQSLVNRALAAGGLGPATAARLGRLNESLLTLRSLGASLGSDIPLQGAQELAVSFSRVVFRCPSDLFAALTIDAEGLVTLLRQAAFQITRVCDFSLRPDLRSRAELAVSFEVAFTVAVYGAPVMGPVRPAFAWGSVVVVLGLMLSQLASRRRDRRPPRPER